MDDKELERGLLLMRLFWLVIFVCQVALLVGPLLHVGHMKGEMAPYTPELCVAGAIGLLAWLFIGPTRALVRDMKEQLVVETTPDGTRVENPRRATLRALRQFSMSFSRTWSLPVAVSMLGFMLAAYKMPLWMWLPFDLIALPITLTQFPRLGAIAKLIEKAKGVRCEL